MTWNGEYDKFSILVLIMCIQKKHALPKITFNQLFRCIAGDL